MAIKFKMPAKQDLKGRSSTISNAFAIAVTPFVRPEDDELNEYYEALGIEEGKCAYCVVAEGNGRDHLKPLVKDGMPTGYITDIHNLVPCCQKCNSSKGSKSFDEWYKSPDNISRLKKLGLNDEIIETRYRKIHEFESRIGEPLDYEKLVGTDLWNEYKDRRKKLLQILDENQKFCDKLNSIIVSKMKKKVKMGLK